MQLINRHQAAHSCFNRSNATRRRWQVTRAARERPGASLPQAQILERALGAGVADRPLPPGPSKVENVAQFLKGELRGLFETGVSVKGGGASECLSRPEGGSAQT